MAAGNSQDVPMEEIASLKEQIQSLVSLRLPGCNVNPLCAESLNKRKRKWRKRRKTNAVDLKEDTVRGNEEVRCEMEGLLSAGWEVQNQLAIARKEGLDTATQLRAEKWEHCLLAISYRLGQSKLCLEDLQKKQAPRTPSVPVVTSQPVNNHQGIILGLQAALVKAQSLRTVGNMKLAETPRVPTISQFSKTPLTPLQSIDVPPLEEPSLVQLTPLQSIDVPPLEEPSLVPLQSIDVPPLEELSLVPLTPLQSIDVPPLEEPSLVPLTPLQSIDVPPLEEPSLVPLTPLQSIDVPPLEEPSPVPLAPLQSIDVPPLEELSPVPLIPLQSIDVPPLEEPPITLHSLLKSPPKQSLLAPQIPLQSINVASLETTIISQQDTLPIHVPQPIEEATVTIITTLPLEPRDPIRMPISFMPANPSLTPITSTDITTDYSRTSDTDTSPQVGMEVVCGVEELAAPSIALDNDIVVGSSASCVSLQREQTSDSDASKTPVSKKPRTPSSKTRRRSKKNSLPRRSSKRVMSRSPHPENGASDTDTDSDSQMRKMLEVLERAPYNLRIPQNNLGGENIRYSFKNGVSVTAVKTKKRKRQSISTPRDKHL